MNTGLPAFRTLILQTGGAAATLTLNRPDALNAIDVAMAEDLQRAAQWLETRADIRVVTLQGAGNALCAGGDISMFEGAACAVRASLMDLFTPLNDFSCASHGQGLAGAGAWHRRGRRPVVDAGLRPGDRRGRHALHDGVSRWAPRPMPA